MESKTFEEIAIAHGACHCIKAYKDRGLVDPSCEIHDLELVAKEFAAQQNKELVEAFKRLDAAVMKRVPQINTESEIDMELYTAIHTGRQTLKENGK